MKFSPKLSITESQIWAQIFGTVVKGCNKYFITQSKFSRAFGPRKFQQGDNYTCHVVILERKSQLFNIIPASNDYYNRWKVRLSGTDGSGLQLNSQ